MAGERVLKVFFFFFKFCLFFVGGGGNSCFFSRDCYIIGSLSRVFPRSWVRLFCGFSGVPSIV